GFGICGVVQDIKYMGSADPGRIVNTGLVEARMLAELLCAGLREFLHFQFGSEVQAAGGTGLDAGWFQTLSHAVHAKRPLENFSGSRAELWNVEWTSRHAVAAADTLLLLEIHDPVHILHDRPIGRTGGKAPRFFAVHALVLAHQERERAVIILMLV